MSHLLAVLLFHHAQLAVLHVHNLLAALCAQVYSCSEDKTIRLWDLREGKESHKFHMRHSVNSVAYIP